MKIRLLSLFMVVVLILLRWLFRNNYEARRVSVETNIIADYTFPYENVDLSTLMKQANCTIEYEEKLRKFLDYFVTEYLQWHKITRLAIDKQPKRANRVRLLVFQGMEENVGFGDRIRSIIHTYLAAVASKRLFLIDLRHPFPWEEILINPKGYNFTFDSSIFTWKNTEISIVSDRKDLTNIDRYIQPSRVILQKSYPTLMVPRVLKNISGKEKNEIFRKLKDENLTDFVPLTEHVVPFILKALFRPSKKLKTSILSSAPFKRKTFFSVHARLGIGVGEDAGRFSLEENNLTLDTYSTCLGKLAAYQAKTKNISKFFIATDTEEAKTYLRSGILSKIPAAFVRESTVIAKHVSFLDSRNKSDLSHFINGISDIGVLSMGKSILFIRSGFADMARWFGAMTEYSRVTRRHCQALIFDNYTEEEVLKVQRF